MKNLSFKILVGLMIVGSVAYADGTRGGGEVVSVEGRPVLRDLVDNTVCTWIPGTTIFESNPEIQTILNGIREHHWYLALSLELEIKRLSYCQTTSLVHISTADAEGLTIYTENTQQVAIRLNNMVFFDQAILEQMNPTMRGYVFIHEALHSYFPMSSLTRNNQLRSTVAMIQRLLNHEIDSQSFYYQLSQNQISVLSNPQPIDADREKIDFILRYSRVMNNFGVGIPDSEVELHFRALGIGIKLFSRYSNNNLHYFLPSDLEHIHYYSDFGQRLQIDPRDFSAFPQNSPQYQRYLKIFEYTATYLPSRLLNRVLFASVEERNYQVFDLIVSNPHYDPSSDNGWYNSIAKSVIESRDQNMFFTLLANPNFNVNEDECIMNAFASGSESQIYILLRRPELNLNQTDAVGNTLFKRIANYSGPRQLDIPEFLRILIARGGFDPNAYNTFGSTALHDLMLGEYSDFNERLSVLLSPEGRRLGFNPLIKTRQRYRGPQFDPTPAERPESQVTSAEWERFTIAEIIFYSARQHALQTETHWYPRWSRREVRDNPRSIYHKLRVLFSLLSDGELRELLLVGRNDLLSWVSLAQNASEDQDFSGVIQRMRGRRYNRRLWPQVRRLVEDQYDRLGLRRVGH